MLCRLDRIQVVYMPVLNPLIVSVEDRELGPQLVEGNRLTEAS
jgi:hypothetical protein